jgi:prolipoprotein diacylglyceryltransferase
MSDVLRVRVQLYDVASEVGRSVVVLAGFRAVFARQRAVVGGLVGGTAVGADRVIVEVLRGAEKSLERAGGSLQVAGRACTSCADRL